MNVYQLAFVCLVVCLLKSCLPVSFLFVCWRVVCLFVYWRVVCLFVEELFACLFVCLLKCCLPVGDRREKLCRLPSSSPLPSSIFFQTFTALNNFKTRQKLSVSGKDKVVWPEFHQSKFPGNQGLGLLLALCDLGWEEGIWRSSSKWSEAAEDQGCSLCKFVLTIIFTWFQHCNLAYDGFN